MTGTKLLSFGKNFFIIVGVLTGVLLLLLLISYVAEPEIKAKNIKITNLTDSSATISWISETPSKGSVLVSENNKFDILTNFRKVRFYDDRDTGDYNWILNTQAVERYTHHVTVTNLKPESKYYYKIAGAYRTVETAYPTLETLITEETLKTPDPMYGTFLKNADPDSLIYVTLNQGLELSTFVNDSSSFSLDKTSTRVNYTTGDTINLKLYTKDSYVEYESKVGSDQPMDLSTIKDLGAVMGQVKGLSSSLLNEVNAQTSCTCGAGTVQCGSEICGPNGHKYRCGGETGTKADDFQELGLCASVTQPLKPTTITPKAELKCGSMSIGNTICNPKDLILYKCIDKGNYAQLEGQGACSNPAPFIPVQETKISVNVDGTISDTVAQNSFSCTSAGTFCDTSTNEVVNCDNNQGIRSRTQCTSKVCTPNGTNSASCLSIESNICTGKDNAYICDKGNTVKIHCIYSNITTSEPCPNCKQNGEIISCASINSPTVHVIAQSITDPCSGKNNQLLCVENNTKYVTCWNGKSENPNKCTECSIKMRGNIVDGVNCKEFQSPIIPIVSTTICSDKDNGQYCLTKEGRTYYSCKDKLLHEWANCMPGQACTIVDKVHKCIVPIGLAPFKNDLVSYSITKSVLGISSDQSDINIKVSEPGIYKVNEVQGFELNGKSTVKVLESNSLTGDLGIKFFYDINEDGIKQDNEVYITEPLQVKIEKVKDINVLKLKVGWNLIGNTMVIDGVTSAKDFLNKITSAGGYATHVSTYRNGKWMLYSMRAGTELGKNFNLIPGEGYFVRVHKEVNLTLEGKKIASGSDYFLNTGWNLISLVPTTGMKATGLIDKINSSKVLESDVVTRYSSGRYENVVKDGTSVYGQDFNLSSLEGYFVRLKKGGVVFQL